MCLLLAELSGTSDDEDDDDDDDDGDEVGRLFKRGED